MIVAKDLGKIGNPTIDSTIDKVTTKGYDLSQFTTYELTAELDRRKESKLKEFQELATELYNLGYEYDDLQEIISEC